MHSLTAHLFLTGKQALVTVTISVWKVGDYAVPMRLRHAKDDFAGANFSGCMCFAFWSYVYLQLYYAVLDL